ncbi:histidine phosphatase family protein [Dermabacteraceae bacterium P13138]
MSAARLILARHGETEYNRAGRLQGQTDIDLNEAGRAQARALARTVAALPAAERPVALFSSPLRRALETAQAVGDALGLAVRTDERLLERGFGIWEGLTGEEIFSGWPEDARAWRGTGSVDPAIGLESRTATAERYAQACREIMARHAGECVMIVSHGAATRLAIGELLGLDAEAFNGIAGLNNCHFSTLVPLRDYGQEGLMRLSSHNTAPGFGSGGEA